MSEPLRRVAIAFNPTYPISLALRDRALGWCASNDLVATSAAGADRRELDAAVAEAQALVVLGGDGTFLHAVQAVAAAPREIGILGVNVGRVGFLSQVEPEALEGTLAHLRAGAYSLESRMVFEAEVRRAGGSVTEEFVGLNEAAIVRGGQPRVVRLDVAIGGSHLATYVADGIIVATPTGSTAYSFSAGGPILDPLSRNLVVTALAAYLAAIRSVVVSPRHVVTVRVLDGREIQLSIDGHINVPLAIGDAVEVAARDRPVAFVVPEGAVPFWDLLRRKAELLPS